MAQDSSGGLGQAKAAGSVLLILAGLALAVALESEAPVLGTTFWYILALACLALGALMAAYGWLFPWLSGLDQLRTEHTSLQRENDSLQKDKDSLQKDKDSLGRGNEALQRENADLRTRLRDAERRETQHRTGSFPVPPGATYIQADRVIFTPERGIEVQPKAEISGDGGQEDKNEASESPSHP